MSGAWDPPPGPLARRRPQGRRRRVSGPASPPDRSPTWYYSRCYHQGGVTKRSVSLADDVASAVETAAREDGLSFSAWLSQAAERQLRVREGLRGVASFESEAGPLSAEEIAAGEALLARLLSG